MTSRCAWQLTHGQYLRLVGDYFLEHDGWGVEVMDYTRAYPSYQWRIFRGDVIYTRAYPAHRWQFLSRWFLTLGHNHFRERFYWRYSHSTRYSTLGHTPLIDGRFFRWWFILRHSCFRDCTCWDIALSLAMDFDLSWSIDTSDGLYWGIATSFIFIEHVDFDSYGLCWDVSIFSIRSRDWLICWHTLHMVLLSSCWLGYSTLY